MVAIEVLDSVLPFAIFGHMEILHNFGVRRFRSLEVRVHVVDEYGKALGPGTELRRGRAVRPSAFKRRLVLPKKIENWPLTSLQQRLVKTGGRLVKHARYYWLMLAESHLTRRLFGSMVRRIEALAVAPG